MTAVAVHKQFTKKVEKQIAKHAEGPDSMVGRVSGSVPVSLRRSLSLACHSALSHRAKLQKTHAGGYG